MEIEALLKPRPLLIFAELFLLLGTLVIPISYDLSLALLGTSTILYYTGMTELVSRIFGKWGVKRFTVAYFVRAASWILMLGSAYYTYSAVIENILPFGPKEFVITSVVALIGAGLNYISVWIRNSVLWKIEGLRKSLWASRINSIVLFFMAAIPFIPSIEIPNEVGLFIKILAVPIIGSFTMLAIFGKVFYLHFLLTMECPERS
ncbi:hypothetical protein [Thermococcus sp.]